MALEQRVSDLESKWGFILEVLGTLATKDDIRGLEARMDGLEARMDRMEATMATKDDLKDLRDELRGHIGDLQEDVKMIKGHLLLD